MATAAETRMNLAALQQRDPYIVSIVDTASQVALYKFNAKTNEWVSFWVLGSCNCVVIDSQSRNTAPHLAGLVHLGV